MQLELPCSSNCMQLEVLADDIASRKENTASRGRDGLLLVSWLACSCRGRVVSWIPVWFLSCLTWVVQGVSGGTTGNAPCESCLLNCVAFSPWCGLDDACWEAARVQSLSVL
eukprot:3059553-Amphidinium_carterae.1